LSGRGFRLVKECFGMTVGQTIRSWSVVGPGCVPLLDLVQ
jgi:H+/gluconate symporter-like permease